MCGNSFPFLSFSFDSSWPQHASWSDAAVTTHTLERERERERERRDAGWNDWEGEKEWINAFTYGYMNLKFKMKQWRGEGAETWRHRGETLGNTWTLSLPCLLLLLLLLLLLCISRGPPEKDLTVIVRMGGGSSLHCQNKERQERKRQLRIFVLPTK